jgi:hypothetical protein
MLRRASSFATLLFLAASLVACGDDDASPVDSGTPPADLGSPDSGGDTDAGADVDAGAAVDAGTDTDAGNDADAGADVDAGAADDAGSATDAGSAAPLHCSGSTLFIADIDPGASILLFNPTGADISLSGYQLCSMPVYVPITGTVPARGSLSVPWPGSFTDTNAGGEVALYNSGSFGSAAAQIDFVCWGTGHSPSRKSVAEADGDWTGPCVGAVTGASLTRLPDTDGSGASSYSASDDLSPVTCP